MRKLYQDGDFEHGIEILESALKEKRQLDHGDSVFVFKHLGVMYAANESTRERGKYYMLQLLTIEPTARIMDMYASDMIYMIFKNIQEEFATSHAKFIRAEQHVTNNQGANNIQNQRTSGAEPKIQKGHPYVWIGAAAALVGVGVAFYVLTDAKPANTENFEVK